MASQIKWDSLTLTTKKPDLLAYFVRDFEIKDGTQGANWQQIGAAWFNKDGEGIILQFDALPVSGRVV
jgi:hypothetical protein